MTLEYPQLDRVAHNGAVQAIDNCIAIVQQSIDTIRAQDDGEPRSQVTRVSVMAREHVIALLEGYRTQVERQSRRTGVKG